MKKAVLTWPLLTLLLASCVTINIYFPAAAAEEAARTIVRDVLGKEQKKEEQNKEGGTPSARPGPQSQRPSATPAQRLLGGLLEALVPAAHAAGRADIDISSPAIRRLRAAMAKRQRALEPFYRAGVIGFDRNGLVAIRDLSAASLRDRARVKKLVAEENRDRNALYREIARANGHPEWEPEIRATFARVWAEEARPGYWYQDAQGRWHRR